MRKRLIRTLKLTALSFVVILIQCGIPSSDLFEDLNTPKNLTITASGGTITISFTAFNPEIAFTGFNVYLNAVSEADLRTQHSQHVVKQVVNTSIELNNIVKNKNSLNYPTIQENDSGSNVLSSRSTTTTITYTIEKAPDEQTLGGINWFIGVTAYSSTNNIESNLSNIVQKP